MSSLHTEAICWLRFGKRMPIVATEVGPWHADILGLSDKMSIEVEVKKSKSDLQAEFRNKKAKHFTYANADKGTTSFVPNYLYFFVPEVLGDYTVKLVETACPKAGVAVHLEQERQDLDGRNNKIIRKPTRLRADPPRPGFLRVAIQRMSSELCGRYVAMDRYWKTLHETLIRAEEGAVDAARRAAGSLDMEDPEGDLRLRAAELAFAVESINDFGSLTPEQQQKWLQAASHWLEAQYLNSKEWTLASYNL